MSKTVLINGCSYAYNWNPDKWFEGYNIVNLAECGGSNRRAVRTTVEWILENGNPDYILLPITFLNRFEAYYDHLKPKVEYVSISPGFLSTSTLAPIVAEYMAYEHPSVTLDRFVTDMIMLDGFLKQRNIPYLAWNMCTPPHGMPAGDVNSSLEMKMNWLKSNPRIVDFNFVGNIYLGQKGSGLASPGEANYKFEARHYDKKDYYILENYLNDYRKY